MLGIFQECDGNATPRELTAFRRLSTLLRSARCVGICKIFGLDQTKMFHVEQFGTIGWRETKTKLLSGDLGRNVAPDTIASHKTTSHKRQSSGAWPMAHDISQKICDF
jgi:hypothetical protein